VFEPVSPSADRRPSPASKALSSANRRTERFYKRGTLNGRTRRGRRLRTLIRDFSDQLGGWPALNAVDQALVMECATKTVESEEVRDALARGAPVDSEQSVRVSNVLSRLLGQLERRRKALAPKPPSLNDWLQPAPEAPQPPRPPRRAQNGRQRA
jgi:hypothetical protein